jgi:lipid II:glycine glycyltransferase (peptidoglycan interpeptide bridge formation enzyme)
MHLFLARVKGDVVGGTLLFVCSRRVVLNFYLCRRRDRQELRTANMLAYQTLEWARREGFQYYDFGTSTIDMEPNWGLVRFKEGFGGIPYLRESWKLELG